MPIHYSVREAESMRAAFRLGCTWEQWSIPDELYSDALEEQVGDTLAKMLASRSWEHVYAPLPEADGHAHHNIVGLLAQAYVPSERLTQYATYRRGHGRTVTDTEVVPSPSWPARKFWAMAAYASQINEPTCRPWFLASEALREWVA